MKKTLYITSLLILLTSCGSNSYTQQDTNDVIINNIESVKIEEELQWITVEQETLTQWQNVSNLDITE